MVGFLVGVFENLSGFSASLELLFLLKNFLNFEYFEYFPFYLFYLGC